MKLCRSRLALTVGILIVVTAMTPSSMWASGVRFATTYSFKGGSDGLYPQAGLIADGVGNLYGTTANGGTGTLCPNGSSSGCGTVFELVAPLSPKGTWKETVLYTFTGGTDGSDPQAGLIFDQNGNLYGTTTVGGDIGSTACTTGVTLTGCGVVFELSPAAAPGNNWTETVLYSFTGATDGSYPGGALVFDRVGNLYGVAQTGGMNNAGTVFELTPSNSGGWTQNTLYQFTDGGVPLCALIFDGEGNLYGTTLAGGDFGGGSVFELIPPGSQGNSWDEQLLYTFDAGAYPMGGVIFDNEGNLYGTTSGNGGTVFELSAPLGGNWLESTLYVFGSGHANSPQAGLIFDPAGNLYGTTHGRSCGSIFRLQDQSGIWKEAEYDLFTGHAGPCALAGGLNFGKWRALYSTSVEGGTCNRQNGCGTVFGILP